MAELTKHININGTPTDICDETARADAKTALEWVTFDAQLLMGTYAGRNLEAIFANEITKYRDVWAWLKARVVAGNFIGLRIGDYIEETLTDGTIMRQLIAAIDPYYLCGDVALGHAIVMIAAKPYVVTGSYAINGSYIYWNTTANNNGNADNPAPYMVSNLHRWEEEVLYATLLPQRVRDVIKPHRILFETRYEAGKTLTDSTSWAWNECHVWSPSETEVYGQNVWSKAGYATGFDCQFPIFALTKNRINGQRVTWWLRSVASGSSTHCCYVSSHGHAYCYSATYTWVRPRSCFLVG